MKRRTLKVEELRVESFPTAVAQELEVQELAPTRPFCSAIDLCPTRPC